MTTEYLGQERRKDAVTRHECDSVKEWVRDVDDELKKHTKAEARMEERISQIERDISEVRNDIKTILDIVSKAKGAWWLLGVIATVAGSLVGVFVWAKDHIK